MTSIKTITITFFSAMRRKNTPFYEEKANINVFSVTVGVVK